MKADAGHPGEGKTLGLSQPEIRTCPTCGTKFTATSDSGLCPVCVLRRAAGGDAVQAEGLNPESASEGSAAETELRSTVRRFENYEVMLDRDGNPIELGRGAMGVTYKAFDIDLRVPVTLKVISENYVGDESARLRFLREARAAAKVHHPNVASVFHLGRSGREYFYAMEFVEGETLESLVKRSGRLEVKLALEITSQVAAGLEAVHEQKLVHRDIKPANIMVCLKEDGRVTAKIIDLGLAKGASELAAESAISIPGTFAGTPTFASPEQFAGLGSDIRSDLYSAGITLWEMLAGQVPFRGSPIEVMHLHQHGPLPLEQLKDLPQPVVILLEVLLEKDPAQRLQTPAELLKAILAVLAAVDIGRSVAAEDLRVIPGQRLAVYQKGRKFPERAKISFTTSRARPLAWLVAGLLVAGIAILGINGFFGARRLPTDSSVAPLTLVTAPEKSIAVLPFECLSPNKDDSYFADGVQDEILNNLAKIVQLKVISRTSVMLYRPEAKRDLRQIASALGVANVLEGTVRRSGNRVRVTTELIDARTDNTIWADSYDRDFTDIFATQSEIAQQVASRLSAQLSPEERKSIEEKPTNNLEAYDLYLQAKYLLGAGSIGLLGSEKKTLTKAISLLEEATQKDHQFAGAYCVIARAHDNLYSDRIDHTPERRALGDAAVNEALQLRPDLPEVHLALAFHLYTCYRDFDRVRVQLAIAAKDLPNNPDLLQLTASIDQVQGHWEMATAGLERAASLDPRNSELLTLLADHYMCLRRYRDSQRILDRLIGLWPDETSVCLCRALCGFFETADLRDARATCDAFPPSVRDDPGMIAWRVYLAMCARDFAAAEEILSKTSNEELWFGRALVPRRIWVLWLELIKGNHPTVEQFGSAREQLYQKVEADPTDPFLLVSLALADVALGRKEEAMQESRRALAMRPLSEDAIDGPIIAMKVALVYVWTNQPDLAFEQLNILIQVPRLGLSGLNYGDLKTDPEWDPLRKDPRFDKLLAELAPKD